MTRNRAKETRSPVGGSKQNPRAAPVRDGADAAHGATLTPGLYLVATPIGNLRDITLRALDVLGAADVIACEDTRVTARLLTNYGISTPTIPYHDHNAARARPAIVKRVAEGQAVALVSDAGTPLISDPGLKLVRACAEAGLAVVAIPGPSAALAGLAVAGLPTDRFLFAGFLPAKSAGRRRVLEELAAVPATLVFYETANRLPAALADMADVLGPRPAAVARELTKLYEEIARGDLAELAARYGEAGPPKGEVVVVVGPPEVAEIAGEVVDKRLTTALMRLSVRDAATEVADELGLPRRQLYERALQLLGRAGDKAR
ncbi:MAG: 16S rRNA (cytidine(1402)-2'-O)-methyltransferase [Alphaproteobacteria bacterium]|nr:16S rRNA (cytidine(1402)-2'-O)-methyltransferase [Alphaproteobacteria bacterium]